MIINIENLSKKEKINNLENNILSDLNFSIQDKSIVGVYGDNDTELLSFYNVLVGLEKPMFGSIKYDNEEIDFKDVNKVVQLRRKIGIVNNNGLLENLSTKENIILPLKIIKGSAIEEKYLEIATLFELNVISNTKIKYLSTFEKVKISMAQAYIKNPEVIIFQNVFQELSFAEIKIIKNLILKIKDCSVIIFFKMFDKIFDICESIYILFCGMFIESNKTTTLLQNPSSSITRKIINQQLIGVDYSTSKEKDTYEVICINQNEFSFVIDLFVRERDQVIIYNINKVSFLNNNFIYIFFSLVSKKDTLDSIINGGISVYIL
jgi:ABC-type methionine transport system ATPase subunit